MGAKTSKQAVVTRPRNTEVLEPMTIAPARLVDEGSTVQEVRGLPKEFQDAETLAGFPPSAKFEHPGDCVFGEFINRRESVGPNNSCLYELSVPNGSGGGMTVAVWGSAALDRLFDLAYPPIQPGDRLAFIYQGEKDTKRGLNPVKLFQLKVKRPGQQTKTTSAT
jgi:hypothetical protein